MELARVGSTGWGISCSRQPQRGGCKEGSSLGRRWGGAGHVPTSPHPSGLPRPPPRFSTRFQKGDVAVTVVESAKVGSNVPICKKRGSHKMEVLVH